MPSRSNIHFKFRLVRHDGCLYTSKDTDIDIRQCCGHLAMTLRALLTASLCGAIRGESSVSYVQL